MKKVINVIFLILFTFSTNYKILNSQNTQEANNKDLIILKLLENQEKLINSLENKNSTNNNLIKIQAKPEIKNKLEYTLYLIQKSFDTAVCLFDKLTTKKTLISIAILAAPVFGIYCKTDPDMKMLKKFISTIFGFYYVKVTELSIEAEKAKFWGILSGNLKHPWYTIVVKTKDVTKEYIEKFLGKGTTELAEKMAEKTFNILFSKK